MKKNITLIAITLIATLTTHAQKGAIQLSPAVELGIPIGDFREFTKFGFGLSVKGLYGISDNGNMTVTIGSSIYSKERVISILTPVLVGYRHRFNGFYVEPQLGYGNNSMDEALSGGNRKSSMSGFAWAAGIGYAPKHIDIGVRYQSIIKDGVSVDIIGFRIGYTFGLNHHK